MTIKTPIGIFDSGIGGLNTLARLASWLPDQVPIIYFSDTKNAPYGNKSPQEITSLVSAVTSSLVENYCSTIIIACHTASSIALPHISTMYPDIKFIDINAPTLSYLNTKSMSSKKIGFIGTSATVQSKPFKEIFCSKNIQAVEAPLLAEAIERSFMSNKKYHNVLDVLSIYLNKLTGIDTLILGCTHYSTLTKEIKGILGNIEIIDPSKLLLESIANEYNLAEKNSFPEVTFLSSENNTNILASVYKKILKKN